MNIDTLDIFVIIITRVTKWKKLTKSDKLNKTEYANRMAAFKQELAEYLDGVDMIPFSAQNGSGSQEIISKIEEYI